MYGSIEAGGTKFVCAIADENLDIIKRVSFPTTTPEITMNLVIDFFNEFNSSLNAIGIGSFGPIDIQETSRTYGYITSTPKIIWQDFDFLGTIKKHFSIPIAWTTDVNAAAYGEYAYGNGKNLSSVAYFTIGTGIGGGVLQDDNFVGGFSHPEMGHIMIVPNPEDNYKGNCPFHNNCLEGMASGPAIEDRAGIKGQKLPENSNIWDFEAEYLAQCAYNTTLMFSPDVIILGGGVMKQNHLIGKVQEAFLKLLNNYVKTPDVKEYIVTPKLEDNAGTIGCLALAKREFSKTNK